MPTNNSINAEVPIETYFDVVSSDPSSPTDGQVWYRSDTDEFKGRANGSTVTFTVT